MFYQLYLFLLITLTINSTIGYNEVINKHLNNTTIKILSKKLLMFNNNFTNILHNDKFVYKEQKSVDKKINCFLITIF